MRIDGIKKHVNMYKSKHENLKKCTTLCTRALDESTSRPRGLSVIFALQISSAMLRNSHKQACDVP